MTPAMPRTSQQHASAAPYHCSHRPRLSPTLFAPTTRTFLLLLLSTRLSTVRCIPNRALQAGWSPNTSEVIRNGDAVSASPDDSYHSWEAYPTLYLWLSDSASSPVSYQVIANVDLPYYPVMQPAPWLEVESAQFFNVYALADAQENEPAVVVSTGGLCNVPNSRTDQAASFAVHTAAAWDDVTVHFHHDCYYPRVQIGQYPATDDVIAYSQNKNPNLTPTNVSLAVTANTGEVLQLDVRVVDIGDGQWQKGQNATFAVDFAANNSELASTIVISPELQVLQNATIGSILNVLEPVSITVASTCSDPASSGYVNVTLNFGFERLMLLPVYVTCREHRELNPLHALGVDLLPGAQFASTTAARLPIAVNGSVPTTSSWNVAGQPYTFDLPQRYIQLAVYYNNYQNRTLTGRATVGAGNALVGLTSSAAATKTASNVVTFRLTSNRLTLVIETQCQDAQQLQQTTVQIDSLTDGDEWYDSVAFHYQWTCQQPPLFALGTRPLSTAQPKGNLIEQGQVASGAASGWTVGANGDAGINVNYVIPAEVESVVGSALYLTLQSSNATMFAWSLDQQASQGLSRVAFRMSGTSVQTGGAYEANIPLSGSAATYTLTLDQLLCSTREFVQVSTRLTYGWAQHATITFQRHCEQADAPLSDSATPSGGAVAAIVLLVLLAASCTMCCGYRCSSKGKRGWEVLPWYDAWGAVQDRALGPKRYTGPQMELGGVDDDGYPIGEEVEISSTGGYGSTYQNDL